MREITRKYIVYNYQELSENAKEKVKEQWLETQEPDIFTSYCTDNLYSKFPHSELKIEFLLSCCQGDGVNIYGKLNLVDIIKYININKESLYFTDKEIKTLENYINMCYQDIILPNNNTGYSYCVIDQVDFAVDWIENLQYYKYKNINTDVIHKLEQTIIHIFTLLCHEYEKEGYNYFYEISEEDILNLCKSNVYEFYEDGQIV